MDQIQMSCYSSSISKPKCSYEKNVSGRFFPVVTAERVVICCSGVTDPSTCLKAAVAEVREERTRARVRVCVCGHACGRGGRWAGATRGQARP